ncbi:NAD-dependent epimerase/dehydratase family protein [Acinetobacter sp. HR7]|uniref:NAD-dependent epimerase/dehydratase family protein n=1 Tax=Acinetobacter sp. HR7 TaxID=1509403 RepID=UPI00054EB32F|nr:NAD-dependent epimerase/dehydratase family protein [Acinetobacter sp. HR7]
MTKTITYPIVIGATGLVGKSLVKQLVNEPSTQRISVVVRKYQPEFEQWPKVTQLVFEDFLMLNEEDVSGHTHAFSCLGTTLKQAGSKDAFYNADYTINAHFAELVQEIDAHYLLISAMGANAKSHFFYNRVKGELEDYIQTLSLERISIIRPSLLLGERGQKRLLEDAAQKLYGKFSHLVPDSFKYKPVTAEQVAHTMVYAALNQTVKFEIYDNLAIQKMK